MAAIFFTLALWGAVHGLWNSKPPPEFTSAGRGVHSQIWEFKIRVLTDREECITVVFVGWVGVARRLSVVVAFYSGPRSSLTPLFCSLWVPPPLRCLKGSAPRCIHWWMDGCVDGLRPRILIQSIWSFLTAMLHALWGPVRRQLRTLPDIVHPFRLGDCLKRSGVGNSGQLP